MTAALVVAAVPSRADDAADLRAAQAVFRDVAARLRPSLVRIETVGGAQPARFVSADAGDDAPDADTDRPRVNPFRDDPGSSFELADGPTTGLVWSADGLLITSSFNFVREPLLITATLGDGRRLAAELVARDQVRKVALLKVDADDLPVPDWRESDDLRVGEWAIALGLGFGGTEPSVTVGIVSALERMHGNAVQTDAKLGPANYGGPLCDVRGQVLGLCVPMAQRPGELAGVEMYDAGVGFAVPRSRLEQIVSALMTGRSFYRGWLGISIDPAAPHGVQILRAADPSPMRSAGIEPGDVIVWAEGRTLHHFGDLVQSLYMLPAGEDVYLHMQRPFVRSEVLWFAGQPLALPAGSATRDFCLTVTLARNTELGPLPEAASEPFDPSLPSEERERP